MSLTTGNLDWENARDEEPVIIPPLLPLTSALAKPNDTLCDTCKALELTPRRFVVESPDPLAKEKPHKIILGLVKDIKNRTNCPFCRLCLKALSDGETPDVAKGKPVVVSMKWENVGLVPNTDPPSREVAKTRILRINADPLFHSMHPFPEVTLLANDSPMPCTSSFARLIGEQIDFRMVRNWIAICRTFHGDFCSQSNVVNSKVLDPVTEIPSFRLIDVVDNCLVSSPPNAKYVCLSYVWGKINVSEILTLLKDNVSELEKPGSLKRKEYYEKIPVTIRDAIDVDDMDQTGSKMDAISKMDMVYGAAYITIIAATGTDANAGLPGVHPGTRGITQPIEEIGPGFRLAFKPRLADEFSGCVHSTRAWTFQEEQFANRSLIFAGGQVSFTCQIISDGWREDEVFEDHVIKDQRSKKLGPDLRMIRDSDIRAFEFLICPYTGRSLSYPTDIYNAFAGCTRYFREKFQVNLCHGIPDQYFDWFLLWQPDRFQGQTRRKNLTPSWSWSGWEGNSHLDIWSWYNPTIIKIQKALKKRTWIIWYQRMAHESEECTRIWSPNEDTTSSGQLTNFYGGDIQDRFAPLDCTQTAPTPRKLIDANPPEYIRDSYHHTPGSGFLQFWTVHVTFKVAETTKKHSKPRHRIDLTRFGIFGKKDIEVGTIFLDAEWSKIHAPKKHNFIVLCEGCDFTQRFDVDHKEWSYMVMLIEWYANKKWAERVAVGWIRKRDLKRALGNGPVWKEIVLG